MENLLFYTLAIFPLIEEYNSLKHPENTLTSIQKAETVLDHVDKNTKIPKDVRNMYLSELFYFVWLFFGVILTEQYSIFVAIFALSIILKKSAKWIEIDSTITLILIIFAIIDNFYLHLL